MPLVRVADRRNRVQYDKLPGRALSETSMSEVRNLVHENVYVYREELTSEEDESLGV